MVGGSSYLRFAKRPNTNAICRCSCQSVLWCRFSAIIARQFTIVARSRTKRRGSFATRMLITSQCTRNGSPKAIIVFLVHPGHLHVRNFDLLIINSQFLIECLVNSKSCVTSSEDMEQVRFQDFILTTEPLITFTFFTKGTYDQDQVTLYTQFFANKFPCYLCRISEGSMKAELVCFYSQCRESIKSLCNENSSLIIAGDQLTKGWVRIPLPGASVWDSGAIYKFANALQLEQKFEKCVACMSRTL